MNRIKKGGVFVLSAILIMAMSMSSVFAMSDDSTRQENSTPTATINLEKTLTVDQAGKFPNIQDFSFTFERIEAWDNANTDTAINGANIAKENIPMPAAAATAHHTVSAVTADKVTVTTGDYSVADTGDTTTARTRSTALPITYTKAGYYVYKVNEVSGSVTGVTYDSDAYYVCVYVANSMDSDGNTTDGVYVHSITTWQNMQALTANLNQHNKDIGTDADNPGGTNVNNNSVTGDDDEGKVNTTTNTNPDETTVNFDNLSESKNVVVKKNVKGSLGDRTKLFEFTVTLTGLTPGTTYTISDGNGTNGFTLVSASTGTLDTTAKTITPDASGNATFLVKLRDDQAIKIEGLPVGATYTVNEAASDHIASVQLTSDNTATGTTSYVAVSIDNVVAGKTYYTTNDGTDPVADITWNEGQMQTTLPEGATVYEKVTDTSGTPVIATTPNPKANSAKETALATATETVDASDGTMTVAYTNTRNMATITGVPGMDYMMYGLIALLMAGAAATVIRRRKAYANELD